MGSTVATEWLPEQISALQSLFYQLVTTNLRLIAEVLGLGLYPVLLVHDPLLDAPVHGKFLAAEFADALAPEEIGSIGMMRKGRF